MPTVPAYDLPTQELAATQLNTFQAPAAQVGNVNAANINITDVAGKQADAMGKATMAIGQQMQKIGDEIRDANVKVQDTATVSKMQDILYNKDNGYLWTKGIVSKEKFADAQERFAKAVAEGREALGDPKEQAAYDRAVSRHVNTFNSAISRHAGEQIRVYTNSESEARQLKYADMAVANFGTPQFQQYLNTALGEVDSRAETNGMGKEAREQLRLKTTNNVYGNVVTNLMINNKYTEAKSVLDEASAKGLISEDVKQNLTRTLKTGYTSEQGRRIADNLGSGKGAIGTDADSVIKWVIGVEGGFVADDAGKGNTNLGINATANPDVDVKNLTPAKAAEIYKERYWNGIGADKLPENMRAIAFDAAVNQGVSTANKLVAQANGDPQKLIDLRRAEYAKLISKNPGKYKQYENSWNARLDALQANLGSIGAVPKTLNEQISNIDAMAKNGMIDEQTREVAINRAESNWKMQINGQAQFSRGILDTATQWVQQHPGADVSQMDPLLQQNLKNTGHWQTVMDLQRNGGKYKQNDAAWGRFLLMPDQQKAELTVDQFTNQYRGKLDDDHYQQGVQMLSQLRGEVKKGQNTEIVSNNERIKWAAQTAKIIPTGEKRSETEEQNFARFQREVQQRVVQFENTKLGGKRKVDGDELDTIINGVLTDKVKTGGFFGFFSKEQPASVMDPEKLQSAYVDVNGRRVKLMDVTAKDREAYAGKLRAAGFKVTQQAIAQLWAADHPEK